MMPKCDTCGFAHAQADRCINCGNPDPFRRHRIIKFTALVVSLVLAVALGAYFYLRYRDMERSIRDAESAAEQESAFPPAPAQPR